MSEKGSVDYHKRVDFRALDVFVDAVSSATKDELRQAVKTASEKSKDYGTYAYDRPIWKRLATLLRAELKGYVKNPTFEKEQYLKRQKTVKPSRRSPHSMMRKKYFQLYDVANDYSLSPVKGKYQFGDLAHAKKAAQDDIDKWVEGMDNVAAPLSSYQIKWHRGAAAGIRPESVMEWNGSIHDGELVYKIIERKKNPAKLKIKEIAHGEAPYKHKGYEIWNMGGRHWAYRQPRTDNYIGQFKTVAAAMQAIDKLKKRKSPRKKNSSERFTAKQLSVMRKNFAKIKTVDPGQATYNKMIAFLDTLPQSLIKQLSKAKIKFLSGLALNRIKPRKKNPANQYDGKGPHIVFIFNKEKLRYVGKTGADYTLETVVGKAKKFRTLGEAIHLGQRIQFPDWAKKVGTMKASNPAKFAKNIQRISYGGKA